MSNRRLFETASIVVAVGVLLMFGPNVVASDELAKICVRGSRSAQLISTIQFETRSQINFHDKGSEPEELAYSATIYQQGSKFRVNSRLAASAKHPVRDMTTAYNGAEYQYFSNDDMRLTFSRRPLIVNPTWTVNPLIVPYAWLFQAGDVTVWAKITNRETWFVRFAEAKYVGSRKEDGILFEVVTIPETNVPAPEMYDAVNTVYFAREYGYYPLKSTMHLRDGTFLKSISVDEYEMIDVDNQKTLLPLSVSFHQEFKGSSDEGNATVDRASVRVNEPIDEDLFTLPRSEALVVDDMDKVQADWEQDNAGMTGGQVPRSEIHVFMLVLLNVALITAIVIGWRLLRHVRNR